MLYLVQLVRKRILCLQPLSHSYHAGYAFDLALLALSAQSYLQGQSREQSISCQVSCLFTNEEGHLSSSINSPLVGVHDFFLLLPCGIVEGGSARGGGRQFIGECLEGLWDSFFGFDLSEDEIQLLPNVKAWSHAFVKGFLDLFEEILAFRYVSSHFIASSVISAWAVFFRRSAEVRTRSRHGRTPS